MGPARGHRPGHRGADQRARPRITGPDGALTEPLLFLVGGGLGAGPHPLGVHPRRQPGGHPRVHPLWQYFDRRLATTVDRLGLDVAWSRTGGAAAAAEALTSTLAASDPAIIWPDRYHLGYWNLPPFLDGQGGHPVVAYAVVGGRMHVDDRTLAPLTVPAADTIWRGRVSRLPQHDARRPDHGRRRAGRPAARRGARRAAGDVDHLAGTSTSRCPPGGSGPGCSSTPGPRRWPTVFADRRQALRALASVWEGVESAGMDGGHLRGLFADGLEQAAVLLDQPGLAAEAPRWREIADRWHALAETALPDDVPAIARLPDPHRHGHPERSPRATRVRRSGRRPPRSCGGCGPSTPTSLRAGRRAPRGGAGRDEWAPGRDPRRRGRGGDPPRCRPGRVIASPGDRPPPWRVVRCVVPILVPGLGLVSRRRGAIGDAPDL